MIPVFLEIISGDFDHFSVQEEDCGNVGQSHKAIACVGNLPHKSWCNETAGKKGKDVDQLVKKCRAFSK